MLVYFWRIIEIMYIVPAENENPSGETGTQELPISMLAPGILLAVLTFAAGLAWISGGFNPLLDALNASLGLGGG